MRRYFSQGLLIISLLSISLVNTQYIYAGVLKEEVESYRLQGYEAQNRGDLDSAISWYQKSVNLDPEYATPHNDLGILFETKGWLDRAEAAYLKALSIDPSYEKAHTNLALLYERKGELEKAAFHWMRRYRLGRPNDPWTREAKERLEKLGLIDASEKTGRVSKKEKREAEKVSELDSGVKQLEKEWLGEKEYKRRQLRKKKPAKKKVKTKEKAQKWTRIDFSKETGKSQRIASKKPSSHKDSFRKQLQESLKLAEERLKKEKQRELASDKRITKKTKSITDTTRSSSGARRYYVTAQRYYNKGEYSRALDTLRKAKKEYPDDVSLLDLEISIKNKMKEERIEDHYNEGIMRYRQKNYSGAKKEFEAILNILPE